MRVLHLTTEFPPVIYGGLGTAVGGWAKACARAGVEIAVQLVGGVLALNGGAALYGACRYRTSHRDASPVRKSEEGILFIQCSEPDAIAAGVRAVEEWRPDVVHLHTAMLWYLASAIKAATGKPLVFHVHSVDRAEYDIGNEPNPFLAQAHAQEEAITGSDRLIALTRSEEILLRKYYPEAADKIRVVGKGLKIRTQHYRRCSPSVPKCRRCFIADAWWSGRAYGSCSRQFPKCCKRCRERAL